jgi:hypothetical protein
VLPASPCQIPVCTQLQPIATHAAVSSTISADATHDRQQAPPAAPIVTVASVWSPLIITVPTHTPTSIWSISGAIGTVRIERAEVVCAVSDAEVDCRTPAVVRTIAVDPFTKLTLLGHSEPQRPLLAQCFSSPYLAAQNVLHERMTRRVNSPRRITMYSLRDLVMPLAGGCRIS